MTPICTAPFHGILIETDKTVKPCCAWQGDPLGNLKFQNINEIRNGEKLKNIQKEMLLGKWPTGCKACEHSEKLNNISAKNSLFDKIIPYSENNKLTQLEFNSSNLCNLVCSGCSPSWSSSWVNFQNKHKLLHGVHGKPEWILHSPKPQSVKNLFDGIDLSNLIHITLKGGEPFLNNDNIELLDMLDSMGILGNIDLLITTNGCFAPSKFLNLLNKAKSVAIMISIDGIGELNQYIRFDPINLESSHTDNIKNNIFKFIQNISRTRLHINMFPTVQVHNAWNLKEISDWWTNEIMPINKQVIYQEARFVYHMEYPFGLQHLSDATRFKLADYYESLNYTNLKHIITVFRKIEYIGDDLHNQMVNYHNSIDIHKFKRFIDIVPNAKKELILFPISK